VISALTYTADGRELYRGGSSNTIYINEIDTLQPRFVVLPEGTNDLLKIKVSTKQDVIAANTIDTLVILTFASAANVALQVIPIVVPTFTLGLHAANIAYFSTTTQVQIAGQCPENQFLNDATSKCEACNQNC